MRNDRGSERPRGALAEIFPGIAALPRAGIAELPTPVEPVAASGLDVRSLAVKRDDLTSRAYGGNKVRKLEYLLGKALHEGRRAVITFGAYGSNHALATAVHARALGIEPHAVLTPQAPTPYARATLLAHAGLGTGMHPVEGRDAAREADRLRADLAARDGIDPLVIPMGGTSGLGAVGFVAAACEIAREGHFDVVYLAGGTLGTAIGLAVGFAALHAPTRVVAVRVTPPSIANDAVATRLTADTVAVLRALDPSFPAIAPADLAFELRHDFFEPGYAMVTTATLDAVASARALGLSLETTYTGKAFAALLSDAAAGALSGADVLFWDTYSSAPMPPPGPTAALPRVLQEYLADCDRLFD